MWSSPTKQYQDPRTSSCPSFKPPDPTYTNQKAYDIFPPDAPPDYYYYINSNGTNTPSRSSTVIGDESCSGSSFGSTIKGKGVGGGVGVIGGLYSEHMITMTSTPPQQQSAWLKSRRQFSARGRIILGTFGMIVFLLILAGLVVWIGNAFILPQVPYTTKYSQNTKHMNTSIEDPI
ncbi:hypothetical protein INT45_000811 [Circinella minor]|uniref:Uncharacterized protein n=1 Tax=Circinella minor TaxID=1195481 RepID=A0A8H7RZG9_9FUNG|nr:hypothetical protein INT45_000811 [Circinella minor]